MMRFFVNTKRTELVLQFKKSRSFLAMITSSTEEFERAKA